MKPWPNSLYSFLKKKLTHYVPSTSLFLNAFNNWDSHQCGEVVYKQFDSGDEIKADVDQRRYFYPKGCEPLSFSANQFKYIP